MAPSNDSIIQECADCGAMLDVTSEEPFALMHCPTCGGAMRVRTRFDQFELQVALGAGGMGAVYRALDTNLHRLVALKLLQKEHSENPEFVAQFQKEAAITASINHPHVVKVYSTGRDHGRLYIAMELVDRGSLDDRMSAEGRLPELQALNVGIQIAQGLNAALERGLIHRDIKPGNILFTGASNAKIVDFGLAVLMEHAETASDEVWGTPYYVAPEPLDGRPEDFRSDMYALGATLFHALTGKPPHEANTNSMRELLEIKRQPVLAQTAAPDISSATAHLLNKMLSFSPEDRFQSYPELIQNIEYARAEHLARVAKENQQSEVVGGRSAQPSWQWLTFATAAAVVALGVGGFELRRHFQRAQQTTEESPDESHGGLPIDRQYRDACKLLASGDASRAAAAFRELGKKPGITQPLLDWVSLHAGLAELLAGQNEQATADFEEIEARGVYSPDPAEEKLAKFFVETARLAASEEQIPPSVKQSLDGSTYEAIALLIFALQNWNQGRLGEARAFFQQFISSNPQERHAWVADYKPIARPYIADLKALRLATEASDGASTLATKKEALQVVRQERAGLKFRDKLDARFASLEDKLRTTVDSEEAETAQRQAEADAEDEKALTEAKAKLTTLEQQFKFADAETAAAAIHVTGAKARAERDALIKAADWLEKFKRSLILDITSLGYPAPILKRNGTQLPAGAHRANDEQVEVITPFGSLSAPWSDISFDSVFAMGQAFLKASVPPDHLADREWYLGVFAMHSGKPREGRDLLLQASQAKDEYRDDLKLFIDAP
jgi:serine/threonine protein kinase